MATLPYTIANGDTPDATKLMENFNWLAAGKGIVSDTKANLVALAALNPTVPFDCWATDDKQRLFYCGDVTQGPNADGFIALGNGGTF